MTTPLAIVAKYIPPLFVLQVLAWGVGFFFGVAPSALLIVMWLHLGVSGLIGRIPPIWALSPVAAYAVWMAAVAVNWWETGQAIQSLNLRSGIEAPIPPNVNLVFAKDDKLARWVRYYLAGGRIFLGSDEIRMIAASDPDCSIRTELAFKDGKDCLVLRSAPAPLPRLELTRSDAAIPGTWPQGHIVTYRITEKRADGAEREIGQLQYGSVRRWSPVPLFAIGGDVGTNGKGLGYWTWARFDPEWQTYSFALSSTGAFSSTSPLGESAAWVVSQALADLFHLSLRSEADPP